MSTGSAMLGCLHDCLKRSCDVDGLSTRNIGDQVPGDVHDAVAIDRGSKVEANYLYSSLAFILCIPADSNDLFGPD